MLYFDYIFRSTDALSFERDPDWPTGTVVAALNPSPVESRGGSKVSVEFPLATVGAMMESPWQVAASLMTPDVSLNFGARLLASLPAFEILANLSSPATGKLSVGLPVPGVEIGGGATVEASLAVPNVSALATMGAETIDIIASLAIPDVDVSISRSVDIGILASLNAPDAAMRIGIASRYANFYIENVAAMETTGEMDCSLAVPGVSILGGANVAASIPAPEAIIQGSIG